MEKINNKISVLYSHFSNFNLFLEMTIKNDLSFLINKLPTSLTIYEIFYYYDYYNYTSSIANNNCLIIIFK